MGFLLEPRAQISFQIIESLSLGAYLSPTFLFRIPARIWGDVDRREIAAYQYDMGRFFYPEVGILIDWAIPFQIISPKVETLNEGEFPESEPYGGIVVHFIVDLNAYFPLFHAWDDEDLKFYDQFMASGVVGLRLFFPPDEAPKAPEEPTP